MRQGRGRLDGGTSSTWIVSSAVSDVHIIQLSMTDTSESEKAGKAAAERDTLDEQLLPESPPERGQSLDEATYASLNSGVYQVHPEEACSSGEEPNGAKEEAGAGQWVGAEKATRKEERRNQEILLAGEKEQGEPPSNLPALTAVAKSSFSEAEVDSRPAPHSEPDLSAGMGYPSLPGGARGKKAALSPSLWFTPGSQAPPPACRITAYQKTHLLRLESTTYTLEVRTRGSLGRSWADFVQLHRVLSLLYPGFILYPFPEPGAGLLKALGVSLGDSEAQRVVEREQRALELERYLCYLLEHPTLCCSPAVELFLGEGREQFREAMGKLERVALQEEQEYGGGLLGDSLDSVRGIFEKGYRLLEGWMGSSRQPPSLLADSEQATAKLMELRSELGPREKELGEVERRLRQMVAETEVLVRRGSRLRGLLSGKGAGQLESSIDSVLVLGSKTASSSTFREGWAEWVEDQMVDPCQHYLRLFEGVAQQLAYRHSLAHHMVSLSAAEASKAVRLADRLLSLDERLLSDWRPLVLGFGAHQRGLYGEFREQWRRHAELMSKIWR